MKISLKKIIARPECCLWVASLCLMLPFAASGEEGAAISYRCRHRAAVMALFAPAVWREGGALRLPEDEPAVATLREFASCLVACGGFSAAAVRRRFPSTDDAAARVGRVVHELDLWHGREPRLSAEESAMPDALSAAAVTALVYAQTEDDGLTAAEHCGKIFSAHPLAPFCCRALAKAVSAALNGNHGRRDIILLAGDDAGDDEVGKIVRAALISEASRLLPEATIAGRLQRVLWLWLRHDDCASACARGRDLLADDASFRLLAALLAAHRGMAGLPDAIRCHTSRAADLLTLEIDLFELATRGLLLPVAAAAAPLTASPPLPGESRTTTTAPEFRQRVDGHETSPCPPPQR